MVSRNAKRLKLINDPKVLTIRFEDFVQNNKKFKGILCNHLSIPLNNSSDYRPELSEKNIGKFKKLITKDEINIIESKLSEYIFE